MKLSVVINVEVMAASHLLPQTAGYASNVPARGRPMGAPLLRSDPFAQSKVQP